MTGHQIHQLLKKNLEKFSKVYYHYQTHKIRLVDIPIIVYNENKTSERDLTRILWKHGFRNISEYNHKNLTRKNVL